MILSVAALSVFAVSCGEAAEKVDEAKEKGTKAVEGIKENKEEIINEVKEGDVQGAATEIKDAAIEGMNEGTTETTEEVKEVIEEVQTEVETTIEEVKEEAGH